MSDSEDLHGLCFILYGLIFYKKLTHLFDDSEKKFSTKVKECLDEISGYAISCSKLSKEEKVNIIHRIIRITADLSASLNHDFGYGCCSGFYIPVIPDTDDRVEMINFFSEVDCYFRRLLNDKMLEGIKNG